MYNVLPKKVHPARTPDVLLCILQRGNTEAVYQGVQLLSRLTIGAFAVIVAGVIMLVPLQPILQTEELLPAFNNVVPALFGALGLKYFIKSPKIAVIPLVLMSALCILVPAAISQTSLLLIPSGGLALAIGFVLFKKGKI